MQRLAGVDASFVYMETGTQHMHVVGTILVDPSTVEGGYDWRNLKALIEERLHLITPMRRRLLDVPFGLHHPVWVEDPDFDIDAHIHRVGVPSPGTMRELAEIVGDIASRPLDRNRPLWDMWILEGLADGNIAFVTKMHHAAIDGVTGADLMAHLFDLEPDAAPPEPPEEEWSPDPIPSDTELIRDAVIENAANPGRSVRAAVKLGRGLVSSAQTFFGGDDENKPTMPFTAPHTNWTGAITPHRAVAFANAELEDFKFVKNTFGTTVNDVVLAVCTWALRQYMDDHEGIPDEPLVCSVPVSVHGQMSESTATNQVSSMFAQLPVQLEDPVEVLKAINADTKNAKEMANAIGADMLQDVAQFMPGTLFSRAMRFYSRSKLADRHRPVHNLVISNVPGPPIPLYSAGAQVVGVYPFGPLIEGAGLNITVISNMGNMDFGVIACPELVPDLWDLAAGFQEGIAQLKKLAEAEA